MIHYKDRTWCPESISGRCSRREGCYRVLTPEDKIAAEKWWGGPDFPISVFTAEPGCFVPNADSKQEPNGAG